MSLATPPVPTPPSPACAIVVSFHPDLPELTQLLEQLDRNACDFLLVDNASPNQAALSELARRLSHHRGVLALEHNIGQAAALNLGLARARELGYGLAFLFDQDSGIDDDFCQRMLDAWGAAVAHSPQPVAAIGPRLVVPETGRRIPFRRFDSAFDRRELPLAGHAGLLRAGFLITSGCLLSLSALDAIGPMREDYFIDNVDLEWCFRALDRGHLLYGTDLARLHHRIGLASNSVLVRKGWVVEHGAHRFYYSTRNRLHLHRQPHAPSAWVAKDRVRFALKTLYLLLTSTQRRAYWVSLQRAIRDARQLP